MIEALNGRNHPGRYTPNTQVIPPPADSIAAARVDHDRTLLDFLSAILELSLEQDVRSSAAGQPRTTGQQTFPPMMQLLRSTTAVLCTGGCTLHMSPMQTACVQRFVDAISGLPMSSYNARNLRVGLTCPNARFELHPGLVEDVASQHLLVLAFCGHVVPVLLDSIATWSGAPGHVGYTGARAQGQYGARTSEGGLVWPARAEASILHVLWTCLSQDNLPVNVLRAAMLATVYPLT